MNKNIFLLLTLALLVSTFTVISGCGKYAAQYSAPVILERHPPAGTGDIGTTETLWIEFSKSMDTSGTSSIENMIAKIKYATDMTATVTFCAGLTPEATWSDNDTELTLTNIFFVADPGNRIHIQSSKEAFEDVNGQYITENADLWNFTLSGLNIMSRIPTLDATVTNSSILHEITFNNPIATYEYFMGPSHTAGTPEPLMPTIYVSVDNKTITFEVNLWEFDSSTVEVTYEAQDIYGNVVINGQLVKYNVSP